MNSIGFIISFLLACMGAFTLGVHIGINIGKKLKSMEDTKQP